MKGNWKTRTLCGTILAAAVTATCAAGGGDCRPETWFHVIGGNASKAGLTADPEALKDAVKSSPPQMADGV